METKPTAFRLDVALMARMDAVQADLGISKAEQVRRALALYLPERERLARELKSSLKIVNRGRK